MPNNTTNIMTVSGPRPKLKRFKMMVSSKNPELIIRYRKEFEDTIASCTKVLSCDPNNHYNKQQLNAAQNKLKELNKGTYNVDLDFDGTFPMPIELEGTSSPAQSAEEIKLQAEYTKKYGAGNWYDWQNKYRGCKCNAYEVEEPEDSIDGIIYRYQTAWSPAILWIEHTSNMFPTLTFEIAATDEGGYSTDEGGYYYLVNVYKAGECTKEERMNQHEWRMIYDQPYAETFNAVFSEGYEEGIMYAVEQGSIDYSMEELLLDFIKDDDLPLFINFEWNNEDVSEDYNERLKTLDKDTVEKKRKSKKKAKANA